MTILHSLILGIVEGIAEFLPISSTGHLILASGLLKIAQSNFTKSFEIIIQLGAVLSVVVLYWKLFFKIENLKKLIVGFIPTGIIGLVLYKIVKMYLIGNQALVIWSLFFGGVILIVFELWYAKKMNGVGGDLEKSENSSENSIALISYKQSLWVGFCQSLAIIPGVSRSAATIIGGLFVGINRKSIVEFSFLLAVPTMLAASGLDILKNASSFSKDQFGVLAVGFIVSFIVAIFSIKFLLRFIKDHSFIWFGVYRMLVAVIFWLVILK